MLLSTKLLRSFFLYFRKLLNKVNRNKRMLTIQPNKSLSTKANKTFYIQTKDRFCRQALVFVTRSTHCP